MESEREYKLILKGGYNSYNRPRKFIPLHSTVLVSGVWPTVCFVCKTEKQFRYQALDLGNRKNCKTKTANENVSPVLRINERTNTAIDRRRLALKSVRQRNVDYVVQQTLLEGLQPNIDHDELIAIENKIKEMQNKILKKKTKSPTKASPIRKSRKKAA